MDRVRDPLWVAAWLLSLLLPPPCLPAAPPRPDSPWAGHTITVKQTDTAILRCYLEDDTSKGAWLNRSSIIFAGNDKWSMDPRVTIVSNSAREYSLQIRHVEVTDDGPYTCSVQTHQDPRTAQIQLTVQVPPKIYDISADSVVNEYSNVSLVCLATGRPEPVITWRHISPLARNFDSEGEYLEIAGITRDQAGEYECLAQNDVSVQNVRKVRVTVNYAPTTMEIKSPEMVLGREGLLRCEALAVPAAAFQWYRGEKRLSSGRQGIKIQNFSTRSVLTVSNITSDHYGNYTCVAINKLGTSSTSHILHKFIEPTSLTSPSLPTSVPPTTVPSAGMTGNAAEGLLARAWCLALALSCLASVWQ